jgi:signal transduction histidine kinase
VIKLNVVQSKFVFILLLFSVFLLISGQASAKNLSLEHKKSSLVGKLIKYVSWPEEDKKSTFILGVFDDKKKYSALKRFFTNREIKNKAISVLLINRSEQAKQVDLLYVPLQHQQKLVALVQATRGTHVLVVSENYKNNKEVMINLLYNNNSSKIAFEINKANLTQENLAISSRLLFLGGKEVATAIAYKGNKNSKIKNKTTTNKKSQRKSLLDEQLTLLEQDFVAQEEKLTLLNQQIKEREKKSAYYYSALENQTAKLTRIQQEIKKQQQVVKVKTKKTSQLSTQLKNELKKAQAKAKLLTATKAENKTLVQINKENKTTLSQQTTKIENLLAQLATKTADNKKLNILNTKTKSRDKQDSNSNFGLYLFIIIALAAVSLAVILWGRYKKALQQLNDTNMVLKTRENQLVKSENIASFGYLASDITYAVGSSLPTALTASLALTKTVEIKQKITDNSLKLPEMKHYIEKVEKLSNDNVKVLEPLVALLDNFNQIAVDQDEDEKQTFDLVSYTEKMMALFAVEFQQSAVQYSYSGENKLIVNSIPGQIAQVLLNLVTNSLKHGFDNKGSGKIAIKIEKLAKSGVKISYQDDGVGMNKATLEQLFIPYFSGPKQRGYVGIGLSIAKDIVTNKLFGDIKVASNTGKGTTFTITLP